jgi:GNAT superfamily N-acetyltransferase
MQPQIIKNGPITPKEIADLRQCVGWDRSESSYHQVLKKHHTYSVRNQHGDLIAYVSVLTDEVADAFLLDLLVHPDFQGQGIGKQIVQFAISDMRESGVQCVQVTFNDELEEFYKKCGFHIFKGGIVDFKNMEWNPDKPN